MHAPLQLNFITECAESYARTIANLASCVSFYVYVPRANSFHSIFKNFLLYSNNNKKNYQEHKVGKYAPITVPQIEIFKLEVSITMLSSIIFFAYSCIFTSRKEKN
jgi:hypothetical protein